MERDEFVPPAPLKTAVLFIVFNRPDTAKQVFEAIRKARPPRLYVAADGPSLNRVGEVNKVATVRAICTAVDWPCELKTLFRDENLGCKDGPSSAITWFFSQENQGIILEDDCLPSQSFFWFCEELLDRYVYDNRIFMISGYNKMQDWPEANSTAKSAYFYSSLGGIWGWASWQRAWQYYDKNMSGIEELALSGFFEDLLGRSLGGVRRRQLLRANKEISSGQLDTWDYQWRYIRHKHSALACVPRKSLIANIGHGDDATHTRLNSPDRVVRHQMSAPFGPPVSKSPDRKYDKRFLGIGLHSKLKRFLSYWRFK